MFRKDYKVQNGESGTLTIAQSPAKLWGLAGRTGLTLWKGQFSRQSYRAGD